MRIFPNKWSLKSKGLFSKLIEFYFRWTKKLKRVSALQYNIFDKLRCFEDPRHSLNSTNAPPSSKTIIELLLFVATKAVICWTPFLLRHRFQRGDTTTIIQVCHSYTVSMSMSVSACKCVCGCACMRAQVGVCVWMNRWGHPNKKSVSSIEDVQLQSFFFHWSLEGTSTTTTTTTMTAKPPTYSNSISSETPLRHWYLPKRKNGNLRTIKNGTFEN